MSPQSAMELGYRAAGMSNARQRLQALLDPEGKLQTAPVPRLGRIALTLQLSNWLVGAGLCFLAAALLVTWLA